MDKPRIFLGSSGKQEKLLRGLTRGLEDVAHVTRANICGSPAAAHELLGFGRPGTAGG